MGDFIVSIFPFMFLLTVYIVGSIKLKEQRKNINYKNKFPKVYFSKGDPVPYIFGFIRLPNTKKNYCVKYISDYIDSFDPKGMKNGKIYTATITDIIDYGERDVCLRLDILDDNNDPLHILVPLTDPDTISSFNGYLTVKFPYHIGNTVNISLILSTEISFYSEDAYHFKTVDIVFWDFTPNQYSIKEQKNNGLLPKCLLFVDNVGQVFTEDDFADVTVYDSIKNKLCLKPQKE